MEESLHVKEVKVDGRRYIVCYNPDQAKPLLATRPIFHRTDLAITGHLFASFLALVLMHELTQRLKRRGWKLEWADIPRDLRELGEVKVLNQGKRYLLRTPLKGQAEAGCARPSGGEELSI